MILKSECVLQGMPERTFWLLERGIICDPVVNAGSCVGLTVSRGRPAQTHISDETFALVVPHFQFYMEFRYALIAQNVPRKAVPCCQTTAKSYTLRNIICIFQAVQLNTLKMTKYLQVINRIFKS